MLDGSAPGGAPSGLSGPRYFLVLLPGRYDQPQPARAYWLTDDAVRTVVARAGAHRPVLDPESAEGAAWPPEPSQADRPDRERFDSALLAALDSASPEGVSADELAARVGRSRAWVFRGWTCMRRPAGRCGRHRVVSG